MKLLKLLITTIFFSGLLFSSILFGEAKSSTVPFNELPKETREILAPFEKHWAKLRPAQQQRILNRAQSSDPALRERTKRSAEYLKNLSPKERNRLRKAKKYFDKMSPKERRELRKRFDNMSPEERQNIKKTYSKFKGMPKHKKREIRDKVRDMTPEERRQYHDELQRSKKPQQPEE